MRKESFSFRLNRNLSVSYMLLILSVVFLLCILFLTLEKFSSKFFGKSSWFISVQFRVNQHLYFFMDYHLLFQLGSQMKHSCDNANKRLSHR